MMVRTTQLLLRGTLPTDENDNSKQRRQFSSSSTASSAATSTEVEKFSALSDTWWDSKHNPLISMNVTRMKFIQHAVDKHLSPPEQQQQQQQENAEATSSSSHTDTKRRRLPLEGLTALDIGCGGGLLSESLVRLGASRVHGIDPSNDLIHAAKQHAKSTLSREQLTRLHYHGGKTVQEFLRDDVFEVQPTSTATATPPQPISSSSKNERPSLPPNYFDIVCCLEVIEHVPNPQQLLETASQLVNPNGGLLFVSTMNRTTKSYFLTIVGAEYVMRYLPVGTHQWDKYVSPQEVQSMLLSRADPTSSTTNDNIAMTPVEVAGMVVPPSSLPAMLTRNEWNWELDYHDTDVNWIGCYQKKKKQDDSAK